MNIVNYGHISLIFVNDYSKLFFFVKIFSLSDLKNEISFLCKNLGRDWKSLMRQLGVSESTMETIMSEHRSVREQIYQCFLAWQDQEQEGASKELLIAALRGIERNDLVMQLEDENY